MPEVLDHIGTVLRWLWQGVVETFLSWVCWAVGWPVCRLLTLNRYPREKFTDWSGEFTDGLGVQLVGLAVILGVLWLAWLLR
jgi:hypothetical protein